MKTPRESKLNNLVPLWGFIILVALAIASFMFVANSQAQEQKQPAQQGKKVDPPQIKTWKVPDYMRENLQRELDDFNKRFEAKVQAYKKELKARFKEFSDMPDDAILYLEGGFFITRSDFLKLQEQLRDKLKKEVKGDDKTTT